MNRIIFFIFLTFGSSAVVNSEIPKIEDSKCNLHDWKHLECAIITAPIDSVHNVSIYIMDNPNNINKSKLLETFQTGKGKTFNHMFKRDLKTKRIFLEEIHAFAVYDNTSRSDLFKIPVTNIISVKQRIQVGNQYKLVRVKIEIL